MKPQKIKLLILIIAVISWFLKDRYSINSLYTISIVLAAIFGALLLYRLKKDQQFWYGLIEVLFSISSISYSVYVYSENHEWNYTDMDEIFKRVAFFYLLVRGINNIDDGLNKPFIMEENVKSTVKRITDYISKVS